MTSPPQAPQANAICERMIATLRRELLDRLLIVNQRHLRRILTRYLRHFTISVGIGGSRRWSPMCAGFVTGFVEGRDPGGDLGAGGEAELA
ncbi:integrase core domain-containing protein [Saccharopolyspora shandongensis]|uniref:integrase core domain-containing protein n=1 Tax=Saccharopolyspora shandongensis TaxID=418495 RepID=UPI001C432056